MSQESDTKRARTSLFAEHAEPSTWTYAVKSSSNGTTAYISNADGSKVRRQMPRMRTPFPVKCFVKADVPDAEAQEIQDACARPNLEFDVSDPELVAWGRQLDAAVIAYVAENSPTLMKKQFSETMITEFYRPIMTESKTGEYNPMMRTKFTKAGKYATKVSVVTDPGSEDTPLLHRPGTIRDIEPNDEVMGIVCVSSIWFQNKSMGVTLELLHALVFKQGSITNTEFQIEGVAGTQVDSAEPKVLSSNQSGARDREEAKCKSAAPLAPGTITVNLGDQSLTNDPFA